MSKRRFAMEAALHLYSSQPNMMYPSELYWAEKDERMRELLIGCNLYVIARRNRIVVSPPSLKFESEVLKGKFIVHHDGTWGNVDFDFPLSNHPVTKGGKEVKIITGYAGSQVRLESERGYVQVPTHVLASRSKSNLGDLRDLEVLYVGQGIGKSRPKLAVDRLVAHSTLQRILAEMMCHDPISELIILMFRFEHSRMLLSTGGDLMLEPEATEEEERNHFDRISTAVFDRKNRVSLAEAALINYFQPTYNEIFKGTDFSTQKRMKLLQKLQDNGVTGLVVEICTDNVRAKLYTEAQAPPKFEDIYPPNINFERVAAESQEMRARVNDEISRTLHTHHIPIPLTTSEERNTFLHGTKWNDGASTMPFGF